MSYIEDIQNRKNEIRNNILKGFGLEDTFEVKPDILKAAGTEDLFEKGKWKVGDEKVYQGVTYYVSDFNAKGTPKWRKKKGEGKPSSSSPSGNNDGGSKKSIVETTVTKKTNNASKPSSSSSTTAIDAIKNSNVLKGSRGAKIASISVVTDKAGKKSASIIYKTYTDSYKICNVDIDKKGNVKKAYWQPTQAYSSIDAAKKYVENDDKSISHDWKDEGSNKSSSVKSDNSGTGKDFNIVGASAKNIADNVSDVLNGSVIGTKKIKIAGVNNVSINAYEVEVGNKTFLIHDGVFKNSYSAKGYSRSKGFTITNANGEHPIMYKVNSTGTSFSNAFSSTAEDLAKTIKKQFLE